MKKHLFRRYFAISAAQFFVFSCLFTALGAYTYQDHKQISILNEKLSTAESEQQKLKGLLKKQTEVIAAQNEKMKTTDTQIGAMRRSLNNQASEINRLDNVTNDLSVQKDTEQQFNDGYPPEQNQQERVVEMPVLDNHQIVLPQSQKVFNK